MQGTAGPCPCPRPPCAVSSRSTAGGLHGDPLLLLEDLSAEFQFPGIRPVPRLCSRDGGQDALAFALKKDTEDNWRRVGSRACRCQAREGRACTPPTAPSPSSEESEVAVLSFG